MQLLIVHHDAEMGEQLLQMIRDYTEHRCAFASSDANALEWARGVSRCSVLITQLQAEGINGLNLAASLSDIFAGLQTMFLPEYPAREQRLEISNTKVFPEPIDGQGLLDAIERADAQRQTGMDLFHALDVLQMCCLSERSGAVQLVRGSKAAIVYLLNGRIVHAEQGEARGPDALYEIVPWEAVEFAYDYTVRAPVETITGTWDEAIVAAVTRRKTETASQPVPQATQLISRGPESKPSRWKFGMRG